LIAIAERKGASLLKTFADQAVMIAIENTRLFEAEQDVREQR